ncbi:hypothetical protein D3C76_1425680 [compost metagenome]
MIDWQLYHIPLRFYPQIPFWWVNIQKAHVVIAVWRGKAPTTAARLAGIKHPHVITFFYLAQHLPDSFPHGAVHAV